MMIRAILCGLFGLGLVSPVFAVETNAVSQLFVEEARTQEGELEYCVMHAVKQNGQIFSISQNKEKQSKFLLHFPNFVVGNTMNYSFSLILKSQNQGNEFKGFDLNGTIIPTGFMVVDAGGVMPTLEEDEGFDRLIVSGLADDKIFDMPEGWRKKLSELSYCAQGQKATPQPLVEEVKKVETPVQPVQREMEILRFEPEKEEILLPVEDKDFQRILYESGIEPKIFEPLNKGNALVKWENDHLTGLISKGELGQDELMVWVENHIYSLRSSCEGGFISDVGNEEIYDNRHFIRVDIACSNNDQESIVALLFMKEPAGILVFSQESKADQAPLAIKARDGIATFLRRIQ